MKKIVVKLLSLFIFNKEKRKMFRSKMMHAHIKDFMYLWKFKRANISDSQVLLIETNDAHGEVISGYLDYFRKAGFHIDILVNPQLYSENPFCRNNMSDVNVYLSDWGLLDEFFSCENIKKYKAVFLMTSAGYFAWKNDNYCGVLNLYPQLRNLQNLYIVEHDLEDVSRFAEESFFSTDRLITLGHFDKGVFACPILFGKIKITPKNDVTTFITVGGIEQSRKNHQKLIEAVKSLAHENLKFKVIIVGKGALDDLPEDIRDYTNITGRLSFSDMFDMMEKADFFLPLLDENNPAHERYIKTKVTGSAQLIYAFAKIPVIHEKFAGFYGYNKENAIVYSDLAEAMKQAIAIKSVTYTEFQNKLQNLSAALIKETEDNLRRIMQ